MAKIKINEKATDPIEEAPIIWLQSLISLCNLLLQALSLAEVLWVDLGRGKQSLLILMHLLNLTQRLDTFRCSGQTWSLPRLLGELQLQAAAQACLYLHCFYPLSSPVPSSLSHKDPHGAPSTSTPKWGSPLPQS